MDVMVDIHLVSFEELNERDDISVEQRIFIRDLRDKGYVLIHDSICAYCGKSTYSTPHDLSHPKLGHL